MSELNPTWVIALRYAWNSPWTTCHAFVRNVASAFSRPRSTDMRVSEEWLLEHEAASGKRPPD